MYHNPAKPGSLFKTKEEALEIPEPVDTKVVKPVMPKLKED